MNLEKLYIFRRSVCCVFQKSVVWWTCVWER